jgi:muramoyltetrapeptide carboxypeptidase
VTSGDGRRSPVRGARPRPARAGASRAAGWRSREPNATFRPVIRPPALEPGDRVALVAPAGPVDDRKVGIALELPAPLELEPVPGASLLARAGYMAGTDRERAADFQAAVDGPVQAIWAIRGGYGSLRTLGHVDLRPLRERPRPFIGFSDNTAIHLALLQLGVTSFHGPHAGHEHFPTDTEAAFRAVLMRTEAAGTLPLPAGARPITLVQGAAEGPLVGGNLAMLAATCGTPFQPDTDGAILFLEDVAEPLYRVDRLLQQLRLAGVLRDLAGVAVGEFTELLDPVPAADAAGGPSLENVLAEAFAPLGVPAVMGLPFGHGVQNWTLPQGIRARLDATSPSLALLDPATSERRT